MLIRAELKQVRGKLRAISSELESIGDRGCAAKKFGATDHLLSLSLVL
jgi:hypothetical protein